MANVLVIRLSAIGDVAMTVPVIYSAAKSNPADTFIDPGFSDSGVHESSG